MLSSLSYQPGCLQDLAETVDELAHHEIMREGLLKFVSSVYHSKLGKSGEQIILVQVIGRFRR
jgi:hypothetical protein